MIDTDVIAAALLGEPVTGAEAARVLAGPWRLAAPALWRAELANVVWKAARSGRIAPGMAGDVLDAAEALPIETVEIGTLWRGALGRALQAGHPAYDALFVELAARLGTRVVSYDSPLRKAFPALAIRPADALAAAPSP